jgi:AcrR family transcriptional regulator
MLNQAKSALDEHAKAASSREQAHRHARSVRQEALAGVRRSLVLDAARNAFVELGLEGASMREIARRCGYTPGAIYSYFASKQEVYGALLDESLERLNESVALVPVPAATGRGPAYRRRLAQNVVRAKAGAFFDFYWHNPRELDLGFYLDHGMRPRGLTPVLNDHLNARLRAALAPTQEGLIALGANRADAQLEVTALFAHIAGLLLLSHTGRIRMFGQDARALFARYVESMLARAMASPGKSNR